MKRYTITKRGIFYITLICGVFAVLYYLGNIAVGQFMADWFGILSAVVVVISMAGILATGGE